MWHATARYTRRGSEYSIEVFREVQLGGTQSSGVFSDCLLHPNSGVAKKDFIYAHFIDGKQNDFKMLFVFFPALSEVFKCHVLT